MGREGDRGRARHMTLALALICWALCGAGASDVAAKAAPLTVKAPTVTKQPVSETLDEGESASFTAGASGSPSPTLQWESSGDGGASWSAIAGATSAKLTLGAVAVAQSGSEYRASFTNTAGSASSQAAVLTVQAPPVVSEQPAGAIVEEGQSAIFEAAASGSPVPTVRWQLSTDAGSVWSDVAGAEGDQLSVPDAQPQDSGNEYRAVFANVAGTATSSAATLTIATHHYRVFAWGQNTFGQLGDETTKESDTPVAAAGVEFVTAVAAGRRHSLALLENGTVEAWGAGASGQLGDGESLMSDVPVLVEGLSGVTAIAAGYSHSLALLANGTVMAWGANEAGELGDGNTAESASPVAVRGLSGVTAVAAGDEYSLALLANGTVVSWGQDEDGQLGDGRTSSSDVPVAVRGLSGVSAIAAGGEHGLALLGNGTVMAWGANEAGQLGNEGVEEAEPEEDISDVPVAVEGLSEVRAIAAGARHSLALLRNGTVMGWGEDSSGQLGDGAIAPVVEAPVAASGLSGVSAIAAGGTHSMALLEDGVVMAWGDDRYGELGAGSSGEPSDVPVAVSGLDEVAGIAAGGFHDLAYGEPLPTVSAVSPDAGAMAGGATVTIAGTGFTGASAVRFGARPAASFTVDSPSSITAIAPAGSLGTVEVTVLTAAGASPIGAPDRFSYLAAPSIRKLSAKSGPGAGGTSLTITGANLTGATAVSFGVVAASSFTVDSASAITAIAPAGAGTVEVTVTTPGGVSATSTHDLYSYAPAVDGLDPAGGPTVAGTTVTISGAGFLPGAGGTSFKFGSKQASAVDCVSTTSCTVTAPAGKAGTVAVIAKVGKLKSPREQVGDEFTYG
jgi:alpha-tubulin suppressor-like RCC1 family protein